MDWVWWMNVVELSAIGIFLLLACFAVAALRKELTILRFSALLFVALVGSYLYFIATVFGAIGALVFYFLCWTILFLTRKTIRPVHLLIGVLCGILLAALVQPYVYLRDDGIHLSPNLTLANTIHQALPRLWTTIPLMVLGAYLLKPRTKR